ncbi:hypothetical protein Droror1_Dr00002704 [Drosera rotundifolia]
MAVESETVQDSGDWSKDGLIGLPGLGLGSKKKSLAEILQLAATDGSSTMPQAVLRVLNYKTCRSMSLGCLQVTIPLNCSFYLLAQGLCSVILKFPIVNVSIVSVLVSVWYHEVSFC